MALTIAPPYYPIVFVRGYAMSDSEREATFHDAYNGFADTAVELRQVPPPDYFAVDKFEGQLLRFLKTQGYFDEVNHGLENLPVGVNPAQSIWVCRIYDTDLVQHKVRKIEDHAHDLHTLVTRTIPERLQSLKLDLGANLEKYKVILLAHSMGGLVCRTLIQGLFPFLKQDPKRWIHRFVTMGTPHGGISFGNLPDVVKNAVTATLNPMDANTFNPDRMNRYLFYFGVADDQPATSTYDVHSLGDTNPATNPYFFPVKRCLCLIGSDYGDYAVGGGIVKHITGNFSDGLVRQDCAYLVAGKPPDGKVGTEAPYSDDNRAFWANVHRAHSGYRGIVNSYESFENVHRFLFGNIKADIRLESIQIGTPEEQNYSYFYDFEFLFSVRQVPLFLHRREQDPCDNATRKARTEISQNPNLFLHTAFLNSKLNRKPEEERSQDDDFSHFAFKFRVVEHRSRSFLHLWEHDYPERAIYDETVEIRVDPDAADLGTRVQYRWLSDHSAEKAQTNDGWDTADVGQDGWRYSFPLRKAPSFAAKVVIQASAWPDPNLTKD